MKKLLLTDCGAATRETRGFTIGMFYEAALPPHSPRFCC